MAQDLGLQRGEGVCRPAEARDTGDPEAEVRRELVDRLGSPRGRPAGAERRVDVEDERVTSATEEPRARDIPAEWRVL